MNRILLLVTIIALAFTSCKTTKKMAESPYTSEPTEQSTVPAKVFSVPESTAKSETKVADDKPIAVRKEQVTFTQQSDKSQNESNSYFVIIGSFSQLENAKNYRETLLGEGFTPIILHSETGYYRVCVNSYKNEQEARSRISNVRQSYPKYSDVWLLVKE